MKFNLDMPPFPRLFAACNVSELYAARLIKFDGSKKFLVIFAVKIQVYAEIFNLISTHGRKTPL